LGGDPGMGNLENSSPTEVVVEADGVPNFRKRAEREKSRGLRWERLCLGGRRTKRSLEAIPKWKIVPFALAMARWGGVMGNRVIFHVPGCPRLGN